MKNFRYYLVTGITVVLVQIVYFYAVAQIIFTIFPPEISAKKCQKYLNKYEDEFSTVTEWWINNGCNDIWIKKENASGYSKVHAELNTLFEKCGCKFILAENGIIYYQLWSNLAFGRGVLYNPNQSEIENEFIIEVCPLEQKYWYFYVQE